MPGHKGIIDRADITEVSGAVDIIGESERNAAELFGASRTLFSCSGSSLCISAMLAFCKNGDTTRVAAMRGSHRSFIDSAILIGFDVDLFSPSCTPEEITACITPETAAVFVTSIDYYGNMCDIEPIAKICRGLNLPLLVDNAHGAYLVFTDLHPIKLGAAMSTDSAHKTLPALTGAAYLHLKCSPDYLKAAEDAMSLFGSSSPSYLILHSLDLCNKHIFEEKERALSAFDAVAKLKEDLGQIGYSLRKSDLLRITIDANAYGYSGADYAKELLNCGIVPEMCDFRYVILLFSTITQNKNTQRVFKAMKNIQKKQAIPADRTETLLNLSTALNPRKAYFSPKLTIPIRESVGRVCAGVHVTLPPCAPIVVPGEIISAEAVLLLEKCGISAIDVVRSI